MCFQVEIDTSVDRRTITRLAKEPNRLDQLESLVNSEILHVKFGENGIADCSIEVLDSENESKKLIPLKNMLFFVEPL